MRAGPIEERANKKPARLSPDGFALYPYEILSAAAAQQAEQAEAAE